MQMLSNMAKMFPVTDPTWIMCCVLVLLLGVPLLCERIKVPPLVGMVLAGMAVGPCGLNILERDASFGIFGQVGLYYIMFTAGLSMDTQALKQRMGEMCTFGLLSFGVPFALGFGAAYWCLQMSGAAAIVLACILASHTMVAFSIVKRYGLTQHRSVTLSVAATMISLVLSLFILSVLSASWQPEDALLSKSGGGQEEMSNLRAILGIVGKLVMLAAAIFVLLPRLTRFAFRKLSDDVLQYIFVMTVMLLCAAVCNSLGIEGVLGAFLCGLVMNRYIPEAAPLMRHIDFMGNALFIPYFLIGVGMLIDIRLLFTSAEALVITAVVVIVALLSKCLAAAIAARFYKLGNNSLLMMCGLTSAHAAGALAIVMVGRQLILPDGTPLVGLNELNGVVMLILFSCVFSAFVTAHAARRISLTEVSREEQQGVEDKMLVAMSRPESMPNLVNTAILMRPHQSTTPIVGVRLVLDAAGNERELQQARALVGDAAAIAASAGISLKKVVRSSVNVVTGLSHLMKDFETSEVIMGYHLKDGRAADKYGHLISEMLPAITRQIIIVHNSRPINTIRCIHVLVPPQAEKEIGFTRWLNHVLRLARQLDCRITFYCSEQAWALVEQRRNYHYNNVRAQWEMCSVYDTSKAFTDSIGDDHLVVFVAARNGSASYHPEMGRLASTIATLYGESSVMIIYPDQYGIENHNMAFSTGLK